MEILTFYTLYNQSQERHVEGQNFHPESLENIKLRDGTVLLKSRQFENSLEDFRISALLKAGSFEFFRVK